MADEATPAGTARAGRRGATNSEARSVSLASLFSRASPAGRGGDVGGGEQEREEHQREDDQVGADVEQGGLQERPAERLSVDAPERKVRVEEADDDRDGRDDGRRAGGEERLLIRGVL